MDLHPVSAARQARPGNPPARAPLLIQAVTLPVLGATFHVRYVALPAGRTPVSIDQPALVMGF